MNRSVQGRTEMRGGFTLVELLVVIGIIALLIAMLLPALNAAKQQAASTASLSNLRQISLGLNLYKLDNKGLYPVHSSASTMVPRRRWVDYTYQYMRNPEVYMSPLLTEQERQRMNKPFAHTVDQATGLAIPKVTKFFGGYGYNYQYLGNSRTPNGVPMYQAKDSFLPKSSQTIAVADTHGSRNGTSFWTSEGVYAIDPPLMSIELGSRGSRKSSDVPGGGQYAYPGGNDGDPTFRCTPAERNRGYVNVVFCDGHAASMKLKDLDDFNGDGQVDNGWWNGKGDATVR